MRQPTCVHPDGTRGHAHDDTALTTPATRHDLTGQCAHVHCVARRSRSATRDQRAALAVRDRHCRFPGCTVDAARCIAHHVREWEHGGATCLSNLILLCPRHHGLVHRAKWHIIADPGLDPGHPERWRFHPPETGLRRHETEPSSPNAYDEANRPNHHHTTAPPDENGPPHQAPGPDATTGARAGGVTVARGSAASYEPAA